MSCMADANIGFNFTNSTRYMRFEPHVQRNATSMPCTESMFYTHEEERNMYKSAVSKCLLSAAMHLMYCSVDGG